VTHVALVEHHSDAIIDTRSIHQMSDAIQQHIENIQQQVQIAEAGYEAFRSMYAKTNRPPARRAYMSRLGILRIALMVIMVAGSIVSASHTMPTFMGDKVTVLSLFVGLAAFFMSEVALAAFAYVGVMRHYRETQKEPESLKTLVGAGVIVPFLVMAAANISHEFKINNIELPGFIRTGIILAISLSAPFMSYISGEVFAMFEVIDRVDQEKHDADYAQKIEAWEEKCRAAWGREKINYGGKIRIDPVPVPQIGVSAVPSAVPSAGQERTDNHGYGTGYTKKMDARDIIRTHLQENPDDLSMTVRELADKLGRSKTTVAEVMKEMRQ
jgi:uncharacterized membrane protein